MVDNSLAVTRFVLNLLMPKTLSAPNTLLPPTFLRHAASWDGALAYAERNHIRLTFLTTLDRVPWKGDLPAEIFARFEAALRKERMVLALLDHEMELATETLLNANIPVLVVKGMDVGRRYYPDRTFRPMTDVDLLVPERSFHGAISRLTQENFRPVGVNYPGRMRTEMSREAIYPVVELHGRLLASDTERTVERYWNRSRSGALPSLRRELRVLGPTDHLVYLIQHSAVQHLVDTPIWLCDLHFLIEAEKENIDWEELIRRSRHQRCEVATWFLLRWLRDRWQTAVPEKFLLQLEETISGLRRWSLSRLGSPEKLFPLNQRKWSWVLGARFALKDSGLQALRYLASRQLRLAAQRR